MERQDLRNSRIIVIKIGTSSLVDRNGNLDPSCFSKISSEISILVKDLHKKAILVTSGAIAAGREKIGPEKNLNTIQEKQAAAAIGQGLLIKEYEKAFTPYGLSPAQVLLTRDAFDDRQRHINSRNTIGQILDFGAVPVINENDTVSVEEIKVGDNDTLAALVASLMGADLLVLLSDVPGFMMDGKVVNTVDKITKEIEAGAGGKGSSVGTGGMQTKISAARISTAAGIPMVIASAREEGIVKKILDGEVVGTLFIPKLTKLESRKRWLLAGKKAKGRVIIDEGAKFALQSKGGSLLSVGIKQVKGKFIQGDVISIADLKNKEIGRGITNYTSEELIKIKGKNTSDAEKILGVLTSDEIIHRDNMVIL